MRSSRTEESRRGTTSGSKNSKPECHPGDRTGRLFIVSLGPGNQDFLAPAALRALKEAAVIVGYKAYIPLVAPEILKGKEIISTGMTGEISRCRSAVRYCANGFKTALISSGDTGIYGMAGLALEIIEEHGLTGTLDVEIIPGIPALAAAASLLGAPLMHDFAVVSLSDLLTPWETIRRRIQAAASADFVLVIYNPRSRKRTRQLDEAVRLIQDHRGPSTPVGLVRNAAREGQSATVTTLGDIPVEKVDMLSILIIGNSATRMLGDRMVTPRGYLDKYGQIS